MSIMSFFPFVTHNKQIKTDFTSNVTYLLKNAKSDLDNLIEYEIGDGESCEDICDKLYDNVDYDFMIYVINDITNPLKDWPLSDYSLEQYCFQKYENIYEIAVYRSIETKKIVTANWPAYDREMLTNYEYELELNNAKRNIKLLTPEIATSLYKEIKTILQG